MSVCKHERENNFVPMISYCCTDDKLSYLHRSLDKLTIVTTPDEGTCGNENRDPTYISGCGIVESSAKTNLWMGSWEMSPKSRPEHLDTPYSARCTLPFALQSAPLSARNASSNSVILRTNTSETLTFNVVFLVVFLST